LVVWYYFHGGCFEQLRQLVQVFGGLSAQRFENARFPNRATRYSDSNVIPKFYLTLTQRAASFPRRWRAGSLQSGEGPGNWCCCLRSGAMSFKLQAASLLVLIRDAYSLRNSGFSWGAS
jgi:hypothetical protein